MRAKTAWACRWVTDCEVLDSICTPHQWLVLLPGLNVGAWCSNCQKNIFFQQNLLQQAQTPCKVRRYSYGYKRDKAVLNSQAQDGYVYPHVTTTKRKGVFNCF